MHYPRFEQDGWPLGSGSVESANTCVAQQRLKGPGMHWEGKNVNPMLALRIGLCNDRWQESMQRLVVLLPLVPFAVPLHPILGGATLVQKNDLHPRGSFFGRIRGGE